MMTFYCAMLDTGWRSVRGKPIMMTFDCAMLVTSWKLIRVEIHCNVLLFLDVFP